MSNDATTWGALQTALAPYIRSLPHDPTEDTNTAHMAYSGYQVYGYYSANYGCSGQWYMLVYSLENATPAPPGVLACTGNGTPNIPFTYGGATGNTTMKTVGVNGPWYAP